MLARIALSEVHASQGTGDYAANQQDGMMH